MPRPALEDRPETGADTERSEDRQDGRILAAAASRGRGIGLGAQQATPLPKKQLSVLLAMRFAEPISFSVIFPFVNQMVYELHIAPSEAEVGYYAGLIESLFAFTQFLTVLWWGRLSDRIGRRPVLLAGLVGVSLSTLAFGLADGLAPGNGTIGFVLVLLARGATGATNGNVAAVKSMVGEMTDESNQARAFSLLPLVYAIGQTIGPLLGGFLSHPVERHREWFQSPSSPVPTGLTHFLQRFPFFLPCAAGASVTLLSVLLGWFMLKETLPAKVAPHAHEQVAEHRPRNGLVEEANLTLSSEDAEQAGTLDTSPLLRPSKRPVPYGSTRSDATLASHQTHGQRHASRMASSASTAVGEPEDADEDGACRINPRSPKFKTAVPQQAASPSQPSLWSLILIDHVRIVLSTYLFLALCAAGLEALVVLFLYTPVTQGGLGFSSSEIGAVLGATGFATMAVQVLIFPPLQRRMTTVPLYRLTLALYPAAILMLPIGNAVARTGSDRTRLVWALLAVAMLLKVSANMAFSCNMIMVNGCAKVGAPLGTLNGLAQMTASAMRAIGPAASTSLFAFSVSHNLAGGALGWFALAASALASLICASSLSDPDVQELVAREEDGIGRE